jgi:O-acetyl-ADP-ribose deacetylase (regulator of RNase III)
MAVNLVKGDITRAEADAIVNAANERMLGGGGVDGAIHRAAGPALLEACRALPVIDGRRCPTGEARITPAGSLNARYVIHAVGPRYAIDPAPEALLASAYHNSFRLALTHECRRVAVPALSCGAYGYPLREAAQVAVAVSRNPAYRELDIHFYLFSDDILAHWSAALDEADTPPA